MWKLTKKVSQRKDMPLASLKSICFVSFEVGKAQKRECASVHEIVAKINGRLNNAENQGATKS